MIYNKKTTLGWFVHLQYISGYLKSIVTNNFFIYNKNVFCFISRSCSWCWDYKASTPSIIVSCVCRTAVKTSRTMFNTNGQQDLLWTWFSQSCITFSRKSREEFIVASAYKVKSNEKKNCESLHFPETKISMLKWGQTDSWYFWWTSNQRTFERS